MLIINIQVSADSFNAFDSPNLSPLATVGINIHGMSVIQGEKICKVDSVSHCKENT